MLFIMIFYPFFCINKIINDMNKIVIFASGSGTNAENIIKYFADKDSGTVVAVFTNNPNAKVIDRAKKYQVPTEIFSRAELIEGKILQKIKNFEPDWIILAGFLLKLPQSIINAYPDKIINIHPALLPKYGGKGMYGARVHEAVIAAKEKESGISIHWVNEHYDEGAIIFQAKCSIDANDTADTLANKIHALEHAHFAPTIEKFLS